MKNHGRIAEITSLTTTNNSKNHYTLLSFLKHRYPIRLPIVLMNLCGVRCGALNSIGHGIKLSNKFIIYIHDYISIVYCTKKTMFNASTKNSNHVGHNTIYIDSILLWIGGALNVGYIELTHSQA